MRKNGPDSSGERRKRKTNLSIQAPWSRKGWHTDDYFASRDRELDAKVESAGRGVNPYGYYVDRPGMAINPLMHNPYLNFVFVAVSIWGGLFLFDKLLSNTWFAIACLVFFTFGGLIIGFMSAIRIPRWHRARKVAKSYVAENGGTIPRELRWYT